jgi:hypothetical protein
MVDYHFTYWVELVINRMLSSHRKARHLIGRRNIQDGRGDTDDIGGRDVLGRMKYETLILDLYMALLVHLLEE